MVSRGDDLPGPDELDTVVSTDAFLYVCVLVATFLLGIGEVLYDNCAQTLMPSLVRTDQLEKANGRLWAAQEAANQFAGPPLGSLLLAAGFAVPFLVDAGSFVVSAALISTIALTPPTSAEVVTRRSWRDELVEGVRWLWQQRAAAHDGDRPRAVQRRRVDHLLGLRAVRPGDPRGVDRRVRGDHDGRRRWGDHRRLDGVVAEPAARLRADRWPLPSAAARPSR